MNKLYIAGSDVTNDVTGLKTIEIEVTLNTANRTVPKSLSGDIKIKGSTFKMLVANYFESCDSYKKEIPAVFHSTICGGISIPMTVDVSGMEYCPNDCFIKLPLKGESDDDKCLNKLDRELIYENGFVETNDLPVVYFALQPSITAWLLLVIKAALVAVLAPLILTMTAVAAALIGICRALNALPGINVDCPKQKDINPFVALFAYMDEALSGLGRWTPAPLFREMIEFQARQCGLGFKSSILNDESSSRFNCAWFVMDSGKYGNYRNVSRQKAIEMFYENAPLKTTIDILNQLSILFEADYRIIDGNIVFERRDYFDEIRTIQMYSILDEDDVCYSYDLNSLNGSGTFTYKTDAAEPEGNKVLDSQYREHISWNDDGSEVLKGNVTRTADFAPARFMFDIESKNRQGFLDWEHVFDEFRDGGRTFFELPMSNIGIKRSNDLIIANGQTSVPKILVFEPNFNRSDAAVVKKQISGKFYYYNYPVWYAPELAAEIGVNELIGDFGYINDPDVDSKKMRCTDVTIKCDCRVIDHILNDFHRVYIQTHLGRGIPESYNIKFDDSSVTVTMSGIRIICD